VIEIPPESSAEKPYTVSHTFHIPQLPLPSSAKQQPDDDITEFARMACNQAAGFAVGHTYEVGLGEQMSSVYWWLLGSKADIFARSPQTAHLRVPKVQMVLTNTVTFQVVGWELKAYCRISSPGPVIAWLSYSRDVQAVCVNVAR